MCHRRSRSLTSFAMAIAAYHGSKLSLVYSNERGHPVTDITWQLPCIRLHASRFTTEIEQAHARLVIWNDQVSIYEILGKRVESRVVISHVISIIGGRRSGDVGSIITGMFRVVQDRLRCGSGSASGVQSIRRSVDAAYEAATSLIHICDLALSRYYKTSSSA